MKNLFYQSPDHNSMTNIGGTPWTNTDLSAYRYPLLEKLRRDKIKMAAEKCQCNNCKCGHENN